MPKAEVLPDGFWRTPSGSIRVQLRAKGHKTAVKTFPLFADDAAERRRQRLDAESWATETRRRMHGGVHVSTREAERLTLGDALRRYETEKLNPDDTNQRKDINRLRQILADPISERPLASMRPTDIAGYRDELLRRGWLASVAAARIRAEKEGGDRRRLREIDSLPKMRAAADDERDGAARRKIEDEIAKLSKREGVRNPAKTTISNKIGLITRSTKHLSQTVDGIPDLSGTAMPRATPGRDRRLRVGEEERLLLGAPAKSAELPIAISLAVETTLRRERILELAPKHLVDIGGGRQVIKFPKDSRPRKRTGIVPVTATIRARLEEAALRKGASRVEELDPERSFLEINGTTFDHQWRALVIECGCDDLHFHDLRHEGTSRLFEKGLTTAEVMSITGHSTVEMVDRYSHYSAGLVFDKLVDGPDPERMRQEIRFLITQYLAAGGDASALLKEFVDPTT